MGNREIPGVQSGDPHGGASLYCGPHRTHHGGKAPEQAEFTLLLREAAGWTVLTMTWSEVEAAAAPAGVERTCAAEDTGGRLAMSCLLCLKN